MRQKSLKTSILLFNVKESETKKCVSCDQLSYVIKRFLTEKKNIIRKKY